MSNKKDLNYVEKLISEFEISELKTEEDAEKMTEDLLKLINEIGEIIEESGKE